MNNKTFYYARVSSKEQNLDRQLSAFYSLGATDRDIITDKESGKNLNRNGYQALKNTLLRSGDTLVIKSLDRLSRNKADIRNELEYFKNNGIRLKVIDLPTTMMELPEGQTWVFEMVNNILIEVLGTIAEQERLTIRQRQREGIDSAKAKGKHLGRPKLTLPDNYEDIIYLWKNGSITAKETMSRLGLKKSEICQTFFSSFLKVFEIFFRKCQKHRKKHNEKAFKPLNYTFSEEKSQTYCLKAYDKTLHRRGGRFLSSCSSYAAFFRKRILNSLSFSSLNPFCL